MMRKKSNMKHRNGGRRYHNNNGGGNAGHNRGDHQNLARQKHHATQMREKYMNLAREAQSNADRVEVEYYLQHVDHYVRVLSEISAVEAERFAERQQHAPQAPDGGAENAAPNAEAPAAQEEASASPEPVDLRNQPRMTRAPRAAAPMSAPAAMPAPNKDIPLPGSILTEIPV
jgi:Domain of unknown function (DUF4167)